MSERHAGHQLADHTGDMALVVWAATLPALFDEATRALFDVMLDVVSVRPSEIVPVAVVGAQDREDLLVRFLAELLFLHDARGWLFHGFKVRTLDERSIAGEALGERLDPTRHVILRQVKAVTYHRVRLHEDANGWRGYVVLDL